MPPHTPLKISIQALLSGKTQVYSPQGYSSAIHKTAVSDPILLTFEGLVLDEQADRKVHGGKDKALHHYPFEHYQYWQTCLGALHVLDQRGAFGENISTTGWTEKDICLGDQLAIGKEVIVEVSQSRQPCWKLNYRFNTPNMSQLVQTTGKTGWYYRVRQTGLIAPNADIELIARPFPQWPLDRVNRVMFASQVTPEEFRDFLNLPLVPSWRKTIEQRLLTNTIENMDKRLYHLTNPL